MVQKLTHCLVYALLITGLTACLEDKCEETQTFTIYQPVTVAAADFRATTFGEEAPRELCRPGNIYYYQDHLLIVEQREGIHIFDNADPRAPRAVSFLPIEGITDMAVRNDVLYANNYIDLVAFDISQPEEPAFLGRTEAVFDAYSVFVDDAGRQQFVVEFLPTSERMTINCSHSRWGQPQFWLEDAWFGGGPRRELMAVADFSNNAGNEQGKSGSGIGGSLARFTITQGHLYTVDEYSLRVFDLSDAARPTRAVRLGSIARTCANPPG